MHGSTFPRNVSPYEYHPNQDTEHFHHPSSTLTCSATLVYGMPPHIIVGKHEQWADGSALCLNKVWILWNTFVKIHAMNTLNVSNLQLKTPKLRKIK